jgi:hypothetical protein
MSDGPPRSGTPFPGSNDFGVLQAAAPTAFYRTVLKKAYEETLRGDQYTQVFARNTDLAKPFNVSFTAATIFAPVKTRIESVFTLNCLE